MSNKCFEKLEYHRILEILSGFAKTEVGRKCIADLKPSFDVLEVATLQQQTSQAVDMVNKYGNPPLHEFRDVSFHFKKMTGNSILSIQEILDLATILKMSRELSCFFEEVSKNVSADFSILKPFFSHLYFHLELEKDIFSKIIDENTIDDRASDTLYSIRKSKRSLEEKIKEKLNQLIHSTTYSKYLMEPIVTIRDNRYVIPVKEEYKSKISGLIHDISSSGSTVFMEPTSIFDMNNEITSLKIKENNEIEKILSALTLKLASIINELENNVRLIGQIDLLFAKANYSICMNGISPRINNTKEFHFIKARHPLIENDKVVPIDISLGNSISCLVITGPNTGGKTVALKTVGLLHLMAYSGLMIPAHENSSIYVFDHLFADMGDEQSIAESLSTFSAHMTNIIEITNTATCQSLVLVDELGAGTDPVEGSSLAISILEFLHQIGCFCIATTHYQEIKNYAFTHPGFLNASAEFDIENLKPTYHIISGIPGKSNAFAISKKLGLNPKILDRANSFVRSEELKMEDVLKQIYDDQKKMELTKNKIETEAKEIEYLKMELQKNNSDIKDKEKELIENAKIEAREILLKAKEEASHIIKEMNRIAKTSSSDTVKELNNLRNSLTHSIQEMSQFETDEFKEGKFTSSDLPKGTPVIIRNFNQKGIIVGIPKNGKVQVQVGSAKLKIALQDLRLDEPKPEEKKEVCSSSSVSHLKAKSISSEINVIGLNVEEAIGMIDKYLDDCYLSSFNTVRIVHGKGTGKLRQGIHAFLKKHPHVKSFRLGTFGEGEMGVTVVELKK